jgi:hypothetical protein
MDIYIYIGFIGFYWITLNSNCDAQRASKNLKKMQKVELEANNNA